MKKAFDQTVRDIKRGVNKKVLKVPSIEQKVLDATSNETWGPHGSLLADIALASRNYHEYQMIMSIIWKRVNDTGKNWRHVYKGLTVLEYLVANGSERVIDEIKEHSYQITTLSEFQYIDHTGRDQGNNVRKKSQSLVALVNDKEKIQEVREKAAANWDKFHKTSGSAKYRPGSYPGAGGYEDERYYGSRDDSNNNGYGREREREWGDDRYNRDDDYRGRRSVDGGNYGGRSTSSERERAAYEDDGHYSSRGSNVKADEQQKSSEGVPPSYEDAVSSGRSPVYSERNGEPKTSPPPATATHETPVSTSPAPPPPATAAPPPPPPMNTENNGFDEFDPRGSFQAVAPPPPQSGGADMDLFGDDPFSLNSLAIVPVTVTDTDTFTTPNPPPSQSQTSAAPSSTQPFEDPFGDGPFRAVSSTAPPQSTSPFGQTSQPPQSAAPTPNTANNFGYGGSFDQNTDILADLLPPSGPFPGQHNQTQFPPSQPPPQESQHHGGQFMSHGGQTGFPPQMGSGYPGSNGQQGNFYTGYEQQGSSAPPPPVPPVAAYSNPPSFYQQPQPTLNSSTGALVIVPQEPAKFETKSTVWADTLNRGLVNLNIAGSKTNPLSDIGVDFEALNRREKRMEKTNTTPMVSNVSMGKAMGSGSGMGRAGAGALRPQPNPMMGGYPNPQMGQFQMHAPPTAGYPSGTYNPMMGMGMGMGRGGGQPPYGGGYR
ncbi:hypothetical protein LXL04_033187 [Taraxacum kok-saghyz]